MMRRRWAKRVEGAVMADHVESHAGGPSPAPPPHRHRVLIAALFALGTVIGIAAVLAVWVNRQALNTDNWTQMSTEVLADEHVQTALGAYLVTELFKSGDVQAALESRLPSELQGLAGPTASGLQEIAGRAAPELLASPQVQGAWEQANRGAHSGSQHFALARALCGELAPLVWQPVVDRPPAAASCDARSGRLTARRRPVRPTRRLAA
jgi:hypothetical protein